MAGNDFDKRIGEKLRDYKEQPPFGLFSRIEESLSNDAVPVQNSKPKKRIIYIYRFGAVAAVMAGLVVAYTFLFNNVKEELVMPVSQVIKETIPDNDDRPADIHNIVPEPFSEEISASTATGSRTAASGPESRKLSEMLKETIQGPVADSRPSHKDIPAAEERSAGKPESIIVDIDNYVTEEEAVTKPQPSERIYYPPRQTTVHRNNMLAQGIGSAFGSDKNKIVSSVYLGNFGTGSRSISNNSMEARFAKELMVQDGSAADGPSSTMISNVPFENEPHEEVKLKHRMPVTFGLSFGIPLPNKFAIVTGINYSYLRSSSEIKGEGEYKVTQQIHYLGIPVSLMYSFYSTRGFSMYARGGVMLEKAVYGSKWVSMSYASGDNSTKEKMGIRGVQPSVDAALGLSFRLADKVGLYIEPGISYYFSVNSQPVSYRTEHPTNFSLKVGVRFGGGM